jgi:ABC-type multidrug transport system permease subunit
MFGLLTVYPGMVFYLFVHGKWDKLVTVSLLASVALYFFIKNYRVFGEVKGFIKRVLISTFIVSGSVMIAAVSPVEKNALAGAVFFLFLPSVFISNYLLTKSKPALKVLVLCNQAYNKPLKQDK